MTLENGIHFGMPARDYFAIPAANKSGLDRILEASPLHFYSDYLDPARPEREESPSMYLGTAIHTAVLEPLEFARRYHKEPTPADYPDVLVSAEDYRNCCKDLGVKAGKTKAEMKAEILRVTNCIEFFEDIEAEIRSRFLVLNAREIEACEAIQKNLRSHPSALELFGSPGDSEATVFWNDPFYGVRCKARIDRLPKSREFILDLKSAQDASPAGFAKACANYGYHRQAAWYLDGVEYATGARPKLFVFGVYETSRPYAPAFYYASEEMLEIGRKENARALAIYAACVRSGKWNGYSEEVVAASLPGWYGKSAPKQEETF